MTAVTATDDFRMKALAGTVTTSCLPVENDNYEEANPAEGWRKERKREREALKKSPAYIRGSLSTPAKKKELKEKKGNKVEEVKRCYTRFLDLFKMMTYNFSFRQVTKKRTMR